MRRTLQLAWLAAIVTMGGFARATHAQTCIQAAEYDSLPAAVIKFVRTYTEPADTSFDQSRVALGYPLTSQVTHVTKEQDCKKARDKYNANNTAGGGWTNRVVVVKAGSTYTVLDPGYYYNPAERRMIYTLLNQQFNFIRRIGG